MKKSTIAHLFSGAFMKLFRILDPFTATLITVVLLALINVVIFFASSLNI